MDTAQLFALGITLAWLAGIRAYLTVFGVGLAGALGWVELPEALQACQSPWVLGTAGILAVIEFSADKIPGVDSLWDLLQTLFRVPAGAFLASAAISPDGDWNWTGAVLGGAAALASHGLKSSSRAMINASPEPASNWLASGGEDGLALGALLLVFAHPWWALTLLMALSIGAFALVYLLFRMVFRRRRQPAPA